MTARRILALAFLLCASVCWGQYDTTYATGVTDITSYCTSGTNCWVASLIPRALISIAAAQDGSIYALDASGCAFFYDWQARTYTQQTAWGCGWSQASSQTGAPNYPLMVGLTKTDAGCPSGTKRFYWWFGSGVPSNTGNCATDWEGGSNAELQISRTPGPNGMPSGHSFFWNGSAYTDIGTGWISGSVFDSKTACVVLAGVGTHTNVLYMLSKNGTFGQMAAQPPGPGKGWGWDHCLVTDDSEIVVYGNGTQFLYDVGTNTWKTLAGTAPTLMTAMSKAMMVGLIGGQPNHLNIYAGFISGTTSGSVNQCPDAAHPCGQTAQHQAGIQVTLPGGLMGNSNNQITQASAGINVSSLDFSPKCSLFGSRNDPNCQATSTGYITCLVSGAAFAGSAAEKHPPKIFGDAFSIDMRGWDNQMFMYNERPTGDGGYYGEAKFGATANACKPNTHASCAWNGLIGPKAFRCYDTIINGQHQNDCAPGDVEAKALKYGDEHSISHVPDPRAWMMIDTYYLVNGVPLCIGPALVASAPAFLACK